MLYNTGIAVHKTSMITPMQTIALSILPNTPGRVIVYWGKGVLVVMVVVALVGCVMSAWMLLRKVCTYTHTHIYTHIYTCVYEQLHVCI